MDKDEESELWNGYSFVWDKVLTQVLGWPPDKVNAYIADLRKYMEECSKDSSGFGFFYDAPSRYLVEPLVSTHFLQISRDLCRGEVNPIALCDRLYEAIAGGRMEDEMMAEDFDWNEAKARYHAERADIERYFEELRREAE